METANLLKSVVKIGRLNGRLVGGGGETVTNSWCGAQFKFNFVDLGGKGRWFHGEERQYDTFS
jgi:hypothetical protein